MTRREHRTALDDVVKLVASHGTEAMAAAFTTLLEIAMNLEREQVLGARAYERTDTRRGYANGYKPKTLNTRVGSITVQVPKARDVEFYPSALDKGLRSERALLLALAEMFVQGVSTRKVTKVLEQLCGLEVSSTQVSRAAQILDEELEMWRSRPLGEVRHLILDARYEKVRHGGSVVDCAILSAIGILPDGRRSVLGTSCSLSEAEVRPDAATSTWRLSDRRDSSCQPRTPDRLLPPPPEEPTLFITVRARSGIYRRGVAFPKCRIR